MISEKELDTIYEKVLKIITTNDSSESNSKEVNNEKPR